MQGNAKLWPFLILNGKSAVFESQSGKFEFTEKWRNIELHKTRSKFIYLIFWVYKIIMNLQFTVYLPYPKYILQTY